MHNQSPIPNDVDAIVVVFVMDGCGHCHDFMPTFNRIARSWNRTVPAYVLKADDPNPEIQRLADRLKVTGTPTTAAIRRYSSGAAKIEGAGSAQQVNELFKQAHEINTGLRR